MSISGSCINYKMPSVVSGRFITKLTMLAVIWVLIIMTALHLHTTINMDLMPSIPRLNSRFLLQKQQISSSSSSSDSAQYGSHSLSSTTEYVPNVAVGGGGPREPSIDRSPTITEDKLVADIQRRMPNLPLLRHQPAPNKLTAWNATCARYPNIFDIEYNNLYWQTLRTSNGTFQLFGAYLDRRKRNALGPTVRLLGMIDRIEPSVVTYCQFWFEGRQSPVITKTFEYKYIWYRKWGNYKHGIYQPYLIACILPRDYRTKVPQSISLVEKQCQNATNNLRVIYNPMPDAENTTQTRPDNFAVCVKGLDFLHEDLSVRLVEWIELLGLLGAEKIFFYQLQVHPNISTVLQYYEAIGRIEVTPMSLAGGQPNVPSFQHLYLTKKTNHKRQNELIPYNDCFYRNMYRYRYIVLLDIDEVIMPVQVRQWADLMPMVRQKAAATQKDDSASFNVRNVYFLDDLQHKHGWYPDVPRYMHILQHVHRTVNYTKPGQYVKCFHNTDKVLTLHNHFPLACLGGACATYAINTSDAQLQHYRADCVKTLKKSCEDFRRTSVKDALAWRYKDDLIRRTNDVLWRLGYFKNGGVETTSNTPSSSNHTR